MILTYYGISSGADKPNGFVNNFMETGLQFVFFWADLLGDQ